MPTIRPSKNATFVKWLRPDLVPAASNLECHSCERFFSECDIRQVLRHPLGGGLVLCKGLKPVAYVLFLKNNKQAHLVNLVVHPDWRRKGMGSVLVDQLKKRANRITAAIRETNFAAHLFLQVNDFLATSVKRDHFTDEWSEVTEREDAFVFEFKEET